MTTPDIPCAQPVPTTGRTRIPVGALISHDHGFYLWPACGNVADADPATEFDVSVSGDTVELKAPGFGGDPYRNGSILAKLGHWRQAWGAAVIPAPEGADERAAFEAWMKGLEGHPYAGKFADRMWQGWQARAALAAQPQPDGAQIWAGAGAFIQHAQNAAGAPGHWPDEFIKWYSPGEWLNEARACAVFLGGKLAATQAPAEGAGLVRPKLDASWIAAEDEAGGVFAAGALVEPSPELAYSTDEESYSLDFCSMLDSLRCDYDDAELVGKPYWVGDKHQHPASHFFNGSAERLIEHAQSFAWDNFGEYTDDFLDDVKPEAVAELQALIEAWADKHVNVNFWTVVNVRKLAVTEEDLT